MDDLPYANLYILKEHCSSQREITQTHRETIYSKAQNHSTWESNPGPYCFEATLPNLNKTSGILYFSLCTFWDHT